MCRLSFLGWCCQRALRDHSSVPSRTVVMLTPALRESWVTRMGLRESTAAVICIRKMTGHWPCTPKRMEWQKLRSVVAWFLQAGVSNDCRKDAHGSVARPTQGTWKWYSVLWGCVQISPGFVKDHGNIVRCRQRSWKCYPFFSNRMESEPTPSIRLEVHGSGSMRVGVRGSASKLHYSPIIFYFLFSHLSQNPPMISGSTNSQFGVR
jgi:hypothetical protein